MKSTEKATQLHILEYLEQNGYLYMRLNSGLHICPATGRRIILAPAGWPDIITMTQDGKARWIGIEVKDKHSYQNPNQKAFQKKFEAMGGLYLLVRSVEEVKEKLQAV